MNEPEKFLIQIEYFYGQHNIYYTAEGPLLLVDHELTHEEAMGYFNIEGDWEIAGVYYIDTDPLIYLKCPHCGDGDFGAVSEFEWKTNEHDVLMACCPACNEGISAEEIIRENL